MSPVTVNGAVVGYVRESWDGIVWSCYNWGRAPIDKAPTKFEAERRVKENSRIGRGCSFIGYQEPGQ